MDSQEIDQYFHARVGPVWGELRGGLWHSTGSHRFRQILADGEIRSSPELATGEFRWGNAPGATTYSRSVGGVSLFDFSEANWDWLFDESEKQMTPDDWERFLKAPPSCPADTWVSTVWIAIDRSKLPAFMHWKEVEADWRAGDVRRKWMPGIEACHKGAIPLMACTHVVVFCAVEPGEFHCMTLHPFDLNELDRLENDWRKRFEKSYSLRALPWVEQCEQWAKNLKDTPAFSAGPPDPELEKRIREANRRLERSRKPESGGS